jgi:hypothetical protein
MTKLSMCVSSSELAGLNKLKSVFERSSLGASPPPACALMQSPLCCCRRTHALGRDSVHAFARLLFQSQSKSHRLWSLICIRDATRWY